MGRSPAAQIMLLVVVALALALGAVGVYAHERETTEAAPAKIGCPGSRVLHAGACFARVDGTNILGADVTPRIELKPAVPSEGLSGPLGRDSAPYWWYGAGAFLVLGVLAVFLPQKPRDA